jgi:hypothetical protein
VPATWFKVASIAPTRSCSAIESADWLSGARPSRSAAWRTIVLVIIWSSQSVTKPDE